MPGWRCPKITYPFNLFVYSGLILFGIVSDEPDVNEYRHQTLSACQLDTCQWHLGVTKVKNVSLDIPFAALQLREAEESACIDY